mmetsp:Transcript_30424/g.87220  ORF Transcript_30424/g.87220 Transcript_30424/m.87220 type:complete len:256 (-) Transcript_30424:948-1715(-)
MVVPRIEICLHRQKQAHTGNVAGLHSKHEGRRPLLLRDRVWLGLCGDQDPHDSGMRLPRSEVERVEAQHAGREASLGRDERAGRGPPALAAGHVEGAVARGGAVGPHRLEVGPRRDEDADAAAVPVGCGEVESREPAVVRQLHVRAPGQQDLHAARRPVLGRHADRRLQFLVQGVQVGVVHHLEYPDHRGNMLVPRKNVDDSAGPYASPREELFGTCAQERNHVSAHGLCNPLHARHGMVRGIADLLVGRADPAR